MTFKPGQSGNPKGKKKGTLHKATLAALELMEGDLEAITQGLHRQGQGGGPTGGQG